MNIIFLTQSKTLEVFCDVSLSLSKKRSLGRVGFYVTDSEFFKSFAETHPGLAKQRCSFLKEWEIIEKSKQSRFDIEKLKEYEEEYADPILWNALAADRRIFLGRRAALEQDYAPRFNHQEMLSILQTAFTQIQRLFDEVKPDVVVGFICVTIGEYIAYLLAKKRGIRFINLRPMRIKNYFYAAEGIYEPSERLRAEYLQKVSKGIPEPQRQEILSYLQEVRKTHAMYEGVVPASQDSSLTTTKANMQRKGLMDRVCNLIKKYYTYTFTRYRFDTHHRGTFYPIWFYKIKRPLRIFWMNLFLRKKYIYSKDLTSLRYAFFPLHKEPEVTLLVYSRPYLNQIEVIRNIARSLKVGTHLVVKEHPAAVGYRPLSYYKKLLAIPNVLLASPALSSRELIGHAELVSVISGSVGLEAIIMKKPVIIFGRTPFGFLPNCMIRHIDNLENLGWQIHDLLKNYRYDENALISYITAVAENSLPVDFYSVLLKKRGVYRPDGETMENRDYQVQIDRLTEHLFGVWDVHKKEYAAQA
ncbi:MAG: hypothetical protein JSW40_01935 [Candidatus Omnitrophota bacterium]|nr:MAG: hypothetical protein JSW40_01935 [Candidatus Omnitrophota bacterium]